MMFSKYLIGDSKRDSFRIRIRLASSQYDHRFFYRHIICTKGLFHASCEFYHFAHSDIYTF